MNPKKIKLDVARATGERIGIDWPSALFDVADLAKGIEVEMEHAAVLGNDLNKIARVAWDHLKECADYYDRLEPVEKACKVAQEKRVEAAAAVAAEPPHEHVQDNQGLCHVCGITMDQEAWDAYAGMPSPGWGKPYGGAAYITDEGVKVWMFRKGQHVRFYDSVGKQVGPEQANVAPAVAAAMTWGWREVEEKRNPAPSKTFTLQITDSFDNTTRPVTVKANSIYGRLAVHRRWQYWDTANRKVGDDKYGAKHWDVTDMISGVPIKMGLTDLALAKAIAKHYGEGPGSEVLDAAIFEYQENARTGSSEYIAANALSDDMKKHFAGDQRNPFEPGTLAHVFEQEEKAQCVSRAAKENPTIDANTKLPEGYTYSKTPMHESEIKPGDMVKFAAADKFNVSYGTNFKKVLKKGRVNLTYESFYGPNPEVPPIRQELKAPLYHIENVLRDKVVYPVDHSPKAKKNPQAACPCSQQNPIEGDTYTYQSEEGPVTVPVVARQGDLVAYKGNTKETKDSYRVAIVSVGLRFPSFGKTLRKADAIDITKFYGGTPEGSVLLKELIEESAKHKAGPAYLDIKAGTSLQAWKEGKAASATPKQAHTKIVVITEHDEPTGSVEDRTYESTTKEVKSFADVQSAMRFAKAFENRMNAPENKHHFALVSVVEKTGREVTAKLLDHVRYQNGMHKGFWQGGRSSEHGFESFNTYSPEVAQ